MPGLKLNHVSKSRRSNAIGDRLQGSWSQHGAHLGPVGPRWAPRWSHELCYQGSHYQVDGWPAIRCRGNHCQAHFCFIESLAPGRCGSNFKSVISEHMCYTLQFKSYSAGTCSQVNPTGHQEWYKSILVQIMAWCRQAISHYLNQCLPGSMTPCGVTMPQSINKVPSNEIQFICFL